MNNTRECMKYFTALADPNDLLKDPLIVDEKALWFEMGSADVVVDLFDTLTWSGNDYERLLDLVHKRIVTHPLHQQRHTDAKYRLLPCCSRLPCTQRCRLQQVRVRRADVSRASPGIARVDTEGLRRGRRDSDRLGTRQ